jgi:hypothetical protein
MSAVTTVQGAYKLLEYSAKPYFHKYWTEIHDVTTIWKGNVCSFIVTITTVWKRNVCSFIVTMTSKLPLERVLNRHKNVT